MKINEKAFEAACMACDRSLDVGDSVSAFLRPIIEAYEAAKLSGQPVVCTEVAMQKELVLTLCDIPPEGVRIMEPAKYLAIHIVPGSPKRETLEDRAKAMFTRHCVNSDVNSAPWEYQPVETKGVWLAKALSEIEEPRRGR